MLQFKKEPRHLILTYIPESWDIEKVKEKINSDEGLTLNRTFFLSKDNLYISEKECIEDDDDKVQFIIGDIKGNYYEINKKILDIDYELYFFKDISISAKHFVSCKNISIFSKIGELKINQSIYIGGEKQNNLSIEGLDRLIKQFPNQHETRLYAQARISRIIKDHFDIPDKAELKYEKYLNKKRQNATKNAAKLDTLQKINEREKEKYIYLSDTLEDMLKAQDAYSEEE